VANITNRQVIEHLQAHGRVVAELKRDLRIALEDMITDWDTNIKDLLSGNVDGDVVQDSNVSIKPVTKKNLFDENVTDDTLFAELDLTLGKQNRSHFVIRPPR
jgi:phosphosulfolactate phosphohydrolase-like enzyme